MDVEQVRQEYDKLSSAITVAAPFVSSLLRRVRIVLSRHVPTAGVDRRGIMRINPDFWVKLDHQEKAWILGHETMHIAFRDLKRRGAKDPILWNIVADAVNNEIQQSFLRVPQQLKDFIVTIDMIYYQLRHYMESQNIDLDDLKAMSKEELYKLIPTEKLKLMVAIDICEGEGEAGGVGGDLEGTVVQEGDPDIYGENGESEDADEKWKDGIARAYSAQKMAGNLPAALKRIVDELLKSKVDWRSLLRQAFKNGFGRTVVSSYLRPSRKHPSFPGVRRYTIPKVWCLVDASGSISEDELSQFLTEIYSIAKTSPVSVISWDAEAYDFINARTKSEVINKVAKMIRGGGGTLIAPALKKTLSRMRMRDIVVVFTDGDIFDLDASETAMLLSEVATKSSVSVFATTHKEHMIDRWTLVKVKVNHN